MGASSTKSRLHHFATVLGLISYCCANSLSAACDRYIAALIACVVLAVLMIVFDVVAVAGGYLAAATIGGMSAARYMGIVVSNLTTQDVVLTVLKGFLFGTVVGVIPAYEGLSVRRGPTEIPQAVIRGTVGSIAAIFIFAALIVGATRA